MHVRSVYFVFCRFYRGFACHIIDGAFSALWARLSRLYSFSQKSEVTNQNQSNNQSCPIDRHLLARLHWLTRLWSQDDNVVKSAP